MEYAAYLRRVAVWVSESMMESLWDTHNNDHFITQLNTDGSVRDFVDYDANLIALAFGIVDNPVQRQAILKRIDAGKYTHVRATWCSEVPYSGSAEDCYIVGGDYCGDSIVTLARIGWVDALARKQAGDVENQRIYESQLLQPLIEDLLADVWLYERYNATGQQVRTSFYFEYPSLVTLMLREVSYGIAIAMNSVRIDPFPAQAFEFHIGFVSVKYSSTEVAIRLPGDSSSSNEALLKQTQITGLSPNAFYLITRQCHQGEASAAHESSSGTDSSSYKGYIQQTSAVGVLEFDAIYTSDCTITARYYTR
mmetsp:Transcript_29073/g.48870  ORF Transcript_29073/g.48870 Transcript_29073/m.48870 type:complete len:309 (+) Transcript_29073:65-991(+)